MARSRGFHPGNATSWRQTGWDVGPGGPAPTSITGSGAQILGSGISALTDGLTLVRVRGFIEIVMELGGVGEGFTGAVGLCVVTDDAFAVGITALPSSITDMSDDVWMYHRFFSLHAGAVSATAALARIHESWEVDSKAMRKIPQGKTLAMVLEVTEIGTADATIAFDSRVLLKLP